jgi:hypothetical protein
MTPSLQGCGPKSPFSAHNHRARCDAFTKFAWPRSTENKGQESKSYLAYGHHGVVTDTITGLIKGSS